MSALKPWGKVFKLQHLFNDIMSVGLYCSGVGVWRVFYPLCKTAAEGLSSIFLKKETSGQGGGVPGHHGEATGWIGTLHSRGDCHMDRKKPRGKAGDLACPGRMAIEPRKGRQYRQSLGVHSPSEVLSGGLHLPAPLRGHLAVPHSDPQTKRKLLFTGFSLW